VLRPSDVAAQNYLPLAAECGREGERVTLYSVQWHIPSGASGMPLVSAWRKKIRFRGFLSREPARIRRKRRTIAPLRQRREVRASATPVGD